MRRNGSTPKILNAEFSVYDTFIPGIFSWWGVWLKIKSFILIYQQTFRQATFNRKMPIQFFLSWWRGAWATCGHGKHVWHAIQQSKTTLLINKCNLTDNQLKHLLSQLMKVYTFPKILLPYKVFNCNWNNSATCKQYNFFPSFNRSNNMLII